MKRAATIFIPALLIVGFVAGLPHYACANGKTLQLQPEPPTYSSHCV